MKDISYKSYVEDFFGRNSCRPTLRFHFGEDAEDTALFIELIVKCWRNENNKHKCLDMIVERLESENDWQINFL